MGTARSIASIIWTATSGGSRLLIKSWWVLRRGRKEVSKSARVMYKELVAYGLPEEDARSIAAAYARPGKELLRIRGLIRLVRSLE
ncbi:MAG: hypothetical protein ACP6KW_00895 [Candidatus Thorarchaeota archaeon]